MHVALTGATGLLGGNLAAALIQAGHTVTATHRRRSKLDHLDDLPIQWVDTTLTSAEGLRHAFEGARWVFHCAASTSVRREPPHWMIDANVTGTQRVIEACRAAGVERLVHCSSTVAVGVSEDETPINESSPWNMVEHGLDDAYVRTKRQAEERVTDAVARGFDAVIVNPGFMFGPRDVKPSSGRMIVEVVKGRIPGNTPGRNNFVHVADVAAGMIAAAQQGRRGERYILGGDNLSYTEVFARIAKLAGVKPPSISVPRWAASLAGAVGDLSERFVEGEPFLTSSMVAWSFERGFIASSAKAEAELGYTHRPVDEGIADAIAWFRAQGRL